MTPEQIQVTKGVILRLEARKKTVWTNPGVQTTPQLLYKEICEKIKELNKIMQCQI